MTLPRKRTTKQCPIFEECRDMITRTSKLQTQLEMIMPAMQEMPGRMTRLEEQFKTANGHMKSTSKMAFNNHEKIVMARGALMLASGVSGGLGAAITLLISWLIFFRS